MEKEEERKSDSFNKGRHGGLPLIPPLRAEGSRRKREFLLAVPGNLCGYFHTNRKSGII
jgi:hypothetical protein